VVYVLLLLGAACAVGFAACIGKYPRLEKAFAIGAGASFFAAFATVVTLLATGRLASWEVNLAGGVFAYEPKGSRLRAGLIAAAGLLLVFVAEVLPRLMGLDLGFPMDVIVVANGAMLGYLVYLELAARRKRKSDS
jgi:hypothetical protein